MFLKRLSAALVGIVCLGSIAVGAENFTQTDATDSGKENPLVAPLALSFGANPVAPVCSGENNGSIDIIITSGVAPFTYRLQKDGGAIQSPVVKTTSTFSITSLSAGKYKIYMTDGDGSASEQETTVYNNPVLLVALESSVVSPSCSGGTANIFFEASGGSGSGYAYNLYKNGLPDGANFNGNFTGKGEGSYFATVTDSRGCTKNYIGTVQVDVPDPINFDFNILSEINCDDGYASVQFFNLPTDPFQIEVRKIALNKTYTSHTGEYVFNNLEAGSYSVKVTRTSCPTDNQTKTFDIAAFAPIFISTSPSSPVVLSCGGINDLTDVSVTIIGGRTGRQIRILMDDNNGATVDQEGTVNYGSPVNFTDLSSGNYTIKWNDVLNPSCSGTQQYVISNPSSPLVWLNDPVGIATKCNGEATGVIQINVSGGTINVSGGTTPYSYFVDGAPAAAPINRPAGTYTVSAQDSKGCKTEDRTVTITQPDPVVVSHNPAEDVHLTCPMGSNGEINMSVTGGVGGYKYDLIYSITDKIYRPNVPTGADITIGALSGNTYDVQVKDANGCMANIITDIVIKEPDPITISQFDLGTIKCNGETAQLVVQAIGGSSSTMTYRLFAGTTLVEEKTSSGVVTFTDLVPSAYTLRVWSNLTCTSNFLNKTFTVVDRKKLVIDNVNDSIMIKCSGDEPSFTLTVQGEAPFRYSIDGSAEIDFVGNSIFINSGLTSSTTGFMNHIVVKDKYDCENDINIKIYEPLPIVVSDFASTPAKCYGKNNGTISLTVSGGIPGYSINLLDAFNHNVVKTTPTSSGVGVVVRNIGTGTYDLLIADKNKCQAPNPIEGIIIEQPDSLYIEDPVYDEIKCNSNITEVTLTASGAWAVDKTINIKGQSVNATIASGSSYSLKAGTYTLKANNTDGCTATRIMTIVEPGKLVLTIGEVKDVSCFGFDDAQISFSVTGGVKPYQYGLGGTGSASSLDFIGPEYTIDGGIEKGSYKLVVRDANLCESNVVSIPIKEPLKVEIAVDVDSVTCFGFNDGKITVTAIGGNDNSYRAFINGVATTYPVISNLEAGTYDIMITDSKGCESEVQTVVVSQPDEIILSDAYVSDSLLCYNDQNAMITVEASGGLPYNLQYRLTGATTRSYQTSNEFNGLAAGEYEVWVRNSMKNCAVKFPEKLIVSNPAEITISSIDVTDVKCHNQENGEVKINAVGGTGTLNYLLIGVPASIADNPNTTGHFRTLGEMNKSFTTYSYRIEDINLCRKTGSFTINNPDELIITALDHFQVSCNDKKDGWIKVNVTGGNGGYTFKKDVGEADVTEDVEANTANVYTIKKYDGGFFNPVVIDAKGCSDSISEPIEIINPELFLIDDIEWGEKLCNGDLNDTTIIHVVGGTEGFYYSLDGGATYSTLNDSIFVGEAVGSKYAIAKDANGCLTPQEDLFLLEQPDLFSIGYKFTGLECYYDEHGDMELNIQGGTGPYTFGYNDPTYSSNTLTITKAATDVTTIKLSDEGIELVPDVTYKFYIHDENMCHVQNVPGLREINEPFADTLFTIPEKLTLIDLIPKPIWCSNEKTGVIEFVAQLGNTEFISEIPVGYTFTATHVERNYSKSNDPGSTKVNELFAGFYECVLVDKYGCKAATRMTGFEYDPNNPDWGKDTTTIPAKFDSIKVYINTIEEPKCDYWFDGWIEVDIQNYREDGVKYIVERWDSAEVRFNMEETDWTDTIPADPAYSNQVEDNELFYANSQRIVEDIGIGLYKITVRDLYTQCEAIIETLVSSVDGDSCPPINYYNAFTPLNGDGTNDEWEIIGSQYQSYTIQIFTALGELIYSEEGVSDNNGIKWNGLDNWGRPAPVGTYIYLLRKFEGTDKEVLIDGNITILRGNGR